MCCACMRRSSLLSLCTVSCLYLISELEREMVNVFWFCIFIHCKCVGRGKGIKGMARAVFLKRRELCLSLVQLFVSLLFLLLLPPPPLRELCLCVCMACITFLHRRLCVTKAVLDSEYMVVGGVLSCTSNTPSALVPLTLESPCAPHR